MGGVGLSLGKKRRLFTRVTERRVGVAVIATVVVTVVEGYGQSGGAVAQSQ